MSQFKKKLTAFTAMLAFLSVSGATSYALNAGTDLMGSTANVGAQTNGNTTNVGFGVNSSAPGGAGAVGQLDWKNFNVGKDEIVDFKFNNLSQTIINRVLGGNQSQILGKLMNSCASGGSCENNPGSGKVILINPAGVMFGAGSMVDLNSFTVSTFDINGIKNLKDVADKTAYQKNVLNKFSPNEKLNGTAGSANPNYYSQIQFDSKYTQAFEDAGLTIPAAGSTNITVEGATFDHFAEGQNTNKTVAMLSDNITYRDSIIKTGDNLNAPVKGDDGQTYYQSQGSVKLITADGATFHYMNSGMATALTTVQDSGTVERSIDINNSGLANNTSHILSGDVLIQNGVRGKTVDGSNIKIANANIRGVKLVTDMQGDVVITGDAKVDISNSRIDTVNSYQDLVDGSRLGSHDNNGGRVYIQTDGDVNISDSAFLTSGSTVETYWDADKQAYVDPNNGGFSIASTKGNVNISNTQIAADGNVKIGAGTTGKVTISDSFVQADNSLDATKGNRYPTDRGLMLKNITLQGGDIDLNDSILDATGTIAAYAVKGVNQVGDINIVGKNINGENTSVINAKAVELIGGNTKLDNTTLRYEDHNLDLYGVTLANSKGVILDADSYVNNVTIANGTTISDRVINPETGAGNAGTLDLVTNGNLTFDNANVQRTTSFNLGTTGDDGTAGAFKASVTTKKSDLSTFRAKSTKGDVIVKNNSNINTGYTMSFTSEQGNVNVFDSELTSAKSGVTIDANKNVDIANTHINADTDVIVTAANGNASVHTNGAGLTANKTGISAGKKIEITAANGNVSTNAAKFASGTKLTLADGEVATKRQLDAHGINFTGQNVNVNSSGFDTSGNINLTATAGDVNVTADETMSMLAKDQGNINILASNNVTINPDQFAVIRSNNGDVNIEATGGSLNILGNGLDMLGVKAGHDMNLIANNTIVFGNSSTPDVNITSKLTAGNKMNVKTTGANSDIIAERTTMPNLTYGDRLTFDAGRDNIFTSADSLKSVNVDYIAGNSNNFTAADDIQFVNSSLKSANNNITTLNNGGDVILNNLTIANADAKTVINAKGNVTTKDVTGSYAADSALTSHSFPKTVEVGTASDTNTVLDLNNSKLVVRTNVDKGSDAYAADHKTGSVDLTLRNANNKANGLDIIAQNDGWDGLSEANEGPEVHLHTVDASNKIAVSRIVTDKLFLDAGTKLTASPITDLPGINNSAVDADGNAVTLTPSSYIEVRDHLGFNQDTNPNIDDENQPDDFTYTGHYDPTNVEDDVWGDYAIYDKHTINYGDPDDNFILVYQKQGEACDDPKGNVVPSTPVPSFDDADSFINQASRLPKEIQGTSKVSAYANNTSDPSANIAASAARIDIEENADLSYSTSFSEEDEEDSEE